MWLVLLITLLPLVIYRCFVQPFTFWKSRGVNQDINFFGGLFKKKSFAEISQETYNKFPKSRYSGMYQFFKPTLLLRDAELIKQITVKDFDHFVDHRTFFPEDADIFWTRNLFSLTGEKWREMRNTLSPAFTSSKMKFMFSLVSKSGQQFVEHFLNTRKNLIVLEMKDAFSRFTNDVIASTVFGVECNSLTNPENEFYLMGKEVTNHKTPGRIFKFFLCLLFPALFKKLKLSLFSQRVGTFFTNLIKENIESREKNRIERPDMIQLLLQARKSGNFKSTSKNLEDKRNRKVLFITDEDIVAQSLLFFFAGFEAVSTALSFMAYEIATNPKVQEKLFKEIEETSKTTKFLTYEVLSEMKYMEMVILESLRKWPPTVAVDRMCTTAYTIESKNQETPLKLEKGNVVWLPIFALHRDPKYYPDPDHFDPERFNAENKDSNRPFLAFGSGPRNCIGLRFAMMEIKVLFWYLLKSFEIVPVEKTQVPLVLSKKEVSMAAEAGFWLGLKRRQNLNKHTF